MLNISLNETFEIKAAVDTLLRAVWQKNDLLSDDQKLEVKSGSVLTGRVAAEKDRCWVVEEATLDGLPVPKHLRFVQKGHWEPVSVQAENAPPVQQTEHAALGESAGVKISPIVKVKNAGSKDAEIKALLDQGKSVSAIAKFLKIGRAQIKRIKEGA